MKDNQHEQLFTELTAESEAPAFEELDNETAAAIGGDADKIQVYRDSNLRVSLGSFNTGSPQLSARPNNQISSIKVNAGTWALYDSPKFSGQSLRYGPGLITFRCRSMTGLHP